MSDMDATPRPWAWSTKMLPPHDVDVYEAATTAGVARILGGNDQDYGDELVQRLAEANADLIVRAVNAYDGKNVYERFIEEMDAMTIKADEPAAAVVGRLTRAVKRAQMVSNGELKSPIERGWGETSDGSKEGAQ